MNDPTKAHKPVSPTGQDETTDQADPSTVGYDATASTQTPSFGDYELITEIARGGMGVVYKAHQKSLNRIVALKMIKSGEFANQEQVDRFYKEAEAAANLDHPGIVPVYEVGEVDGQHYFTMGFVDGESLADRLRNGPLPPKEAARYAKSIAEAVAFAHSKGVIHRDLKPGNVLITKDGVLRITDFGLAKRIEEDSELTSTGQVLGTPSYMPPEQAEGKLSEIGPAADIYAIGGTLYCMLTGRPPFQAANLIETLHQVLEVEPVSLSTLNRSVPQDLETLCLKCLEKKPSNRYDSADELVTELGHFLNGEPIRARPIGRVEQGLRWCKRKPAQATALTAIVLLAIGGPWSAIRQSLLRTQAAVARVDTLLNASSATIPLILGELDRDASVVNSRLHQLKTDDLTPRARLRLSLALLPSDPSQLTYLKARLIDCSYDELAVVLDRMRKNHGGSITPGLWTTFHDQAASTNDRFRAGIALASLAPGSDGWTENDYELLARSMLQEITVYQPAIRESLKPISAKLLDPIKQAFGSPESNETVLESAATAIVDFYADDSELLTKLSMVATPKQHSILFPPVDQFAKSDEFIVETLVGVTKLQPKVDDDEATRVRLGKRRAGAAINLVRMGHMDESLEVLRVKDDPESLTQFVHGCKDRGVSATQLLDILNRATSVSERYGILLTLGEFKQDEIPEDIRSDWVELVKSLYANDPSSGIHGASGWLLREWGLTTEAKAIDERAVAYSEEREWFTLKINVAGPLEFESYSYLTFIVFRAGEYPVGSRDYEANRFAPDEKRRQVTISRSFAILDREVTRREAKVFLEGTLEFPNQAQWQLDELCSNSSTSWYMAVMCCRGLTALIGLGEASQAYIDPETLDLSVSEIDGTSQMLKNAPLNWPLRIDARGFRLPSAVEWEIACRGGTSSRYSFGSDSNLLKEYGWYESYSGNRGHRPRKLRPNVRGLYDMHGNMYEWCHNWRGDDNVHVLTDPMGPDRGVYRVIRGGGWNNNPNYARSATISYIQPAQTGHYNGFRVLINVANGASHPR